MRITGVLAALCVVLLPSVALGTDQARTFTFTYETRVPASTDWSGPVHVFVPLAVENEQQRVLSEQVEASIPGQVEIEAEYGNRFWHGSIAAPGEEDITVRITTTVERRVATAVEPADQARLGKFLAANQRVVVGDDILDPILLEIRAIAADSSKATTARAIYDWVVDNVEYKKVGTGWGNGDTYWACSERYGNCTDFHALFTSLARTEGIPARFEIGFPVPMDKTEGKIGGYHCWVQFHLPGQGWIPVDASEAHKHPEMRDLLFGSQPLDRIHFSTGRDLRLGEAHRDTPLNYFVYPYVEVDGKAYRGEIKRSFAYSEVDTKAEMVVAR